MPRKGQKSVTLPKWVFEKAKEYFEENKEDLAYKRVRSTSGLLTYWIIQKLEEINEKESSK